MSDPVAAAHLAIMALVLVWDVAMAGRIARNPHAPRSFATVAALAGLLVVPALVIAAATSTTLYGRPIQQIAWVWPATLLLFTIQSIQATVRRYVSLLVGVPITLYNLLLTATAVTALLLSRGEPLPPGALTVVAARSIAFATLTGPEALVAPFLVQLPILAPAFPPRRRLTGAARAGLAIVATAWVLLIVLQLPIAARTLGSYRTYTDDLMQERPRGDFLIGLKVFSDLDASPSALAARRDFELADSLGAEAITVVVTPAGATIAALDSLQRIVEERRRAGTRLVVELGFDHNSLGLSAPVPLDTARRLRAVDRIARILRPDILLPAGAPYGSAAVRAHGRRPLDEWRRYLTRAAEIAHYVNPNIRVGVSAAAYDAADSVLYAWAAAPRSPVDIVGFSLQPGVQGARELDAGIAAASRWMRAAGETGKPNWVFAAGGLPSAHGEMSQALALQGALAWATSEPSVHGFIVRDAGDYERAIGLRTAHGRLRDAAPAIARAARILRETRSPQLPAPVPR